MIWNRLLKLLLVVFIVSISLVLMWPTTGYCKPFKLGSLGHSFGFLQVDIAEAQRGFQWEGRQVEVIQFKSGKDAATALLDGELQAAILGIDHSISGQRQGISLKQVMVLNRLPGWSLVVDKRYTEKIQTISDLKSRNIGITSPGSATHILLNYLLSLQGLGPDSVIPVKAGTATLPDFLSKGAIDAGMAVEPFATKLVDSGAAFVLVDFRSDEQVKQALGSSYPMTSLIVRQDAIDNDPATVQHVVSALLNAASYLENASADEVMNLLPQEYVGEKDLWRRAFANYHDTFSYDGAIDPDGIKSVIAAQVAFGKLDSANDINTQDLYDTQFLAAHKTQPPALGQQSEGSPGQQAQEKEAAFPWTYVIIGIAFIVFILVGKAVLKRNKKDAAE